MDPRTRQRTNKIFGKLRSDTKKRKKSDDDVFEQNYRQPSPPKAYESKRKKKIPITGAKISLTTESDEDIQPRDIEDDDDSVADKTYDPSGDLSSSDPEVDFIQRAKKVKKQLFTPTKKCNNVLTQRSKLQSEKKLPKDNILQEKAVMEANTPIQHRNEDNTSPVKIVPNTHTPPNPPRDIVVNPVIQVTAVIENVTPTKRRNLPVKTVGQKENFCKNKVIIQESEDIIMTEQEYLAQNHVNLQTNSKKVKDSVETQQPAESSADLIHKNKSSDLITPEDLGLQVPDFHDVDIESLDKTPEFQEPVTQQYENSEQNEHILESNSAQTNNLQPTEVDNMLSPDMVRTRPVANSSTKKRPRRRIRKMNQWKRVSNKAKRLQGLPYISTVAKVHPEVKARELKPPCKENCRNKCQEKITEGNRQKAFNGFWKQTHSWEQRRQYVANNIEVTVKKMMKTTSTLENDKRKYTYNYSIPTENGRITVCKTMFLNTYDISEKFVRTCIDKLTPNGLVLPDLRGKHIPGNKTSDHVINSVVKHISSFPSYESHYKRESTSRKYLGPELNLNEMYKQYVLFMKQENAEEKDIAKSWLYREIFNTQFNLSFKLLQMDTCDDCDRLRRAIADSKDEDEKQLLLLQKDDHLEQADKRYTIKKQDKEDCQKKDNVRVLFLDLQKCLPTPYLTNTQSFYLRKLWTLNLTIYEAKEKKASNFVWPEMTAGRGGNEVASCLIKWGEQNLSDPTITETITWTDNCSGQNRNMMFVMAYFWLMQKYPPVKTMSHKFLLKGHTHMEVDHVHSIIERKKKSLSTMEIAVPRDWAQFLRSCSGKNAFDVTEMTKEDFKDCHSLTKKGNGPFVLRKKNTEQEEFKISNTVMWQFKREKPGILLYKTSFDQDNFKELNLIRSGQLANNCPQDLPVVRNEEKPISSAKYNDLMTLLQWVPKDFHSYYKNLQHSRTASDLPEID